MCFNAYATLPLHDELHALPALDPGPIGIEVSDDAGRELTAQGVAPVLPEPATAEEVTCHG
jgi:hypothetical protein